MSKKTKVTVRLEPGQAYVVGSVENWEHLIQLYKNLATDADTDEQKLLWLDCAEWIENWVDNTYVGMEPGTEDDEDWS